MRVIVTRPEAQAAALADALRERGFEPVLCPLIETIPIEDGPIQVGGYDWVVLTSANGAAELARRHSGPLPRVAAVGATTAQELESRGISVAFVPREASQQGLVAEFPRPLGRILFVGAEGTGTLIESELGADVRAVYRTQELPQDVMPSGDVVLLASGSAARAWAKLGIDLPAISLGPRTTAAAAAAGVKVVGEARTPDTRGLVDCAAAWRNSSRS
jgi:uroporphyrinogen-III synthase